MLKSLISLILGNRRSSYDYDMGNASLNSNLIFLGIFPAHDLSLSNTMLIGWQN